MRGYITFVLSVAILAIFLHLAAMQNEVSLSRALAAEALYQKQQNAKELLLEGARSGAGEGLRQYWLAKAIGIPFSQAEAERYAHVAAYLRLREVAGTIKDETLQSWCGAITPWSTREIHDSMQSAQRAVPCATCKPLTDCPDVIAVQVDDAGTEGVVALRSDRFPSTVVGISSYSSPYGVGSVAYLPPTEERRFGIYAGSGSD